MDSIIETPRERRAEYLRQWLRRNTLESIEVSPSAVAVAPGMSQQFVATGYNPDGDVIPIKPRWSVDGGGTIDHHGLYTAGASLGTDSVEASVVGGVRGNAVVTVGTAALEDAIAAWATAASATRVSYGGVGFSQLGADAVSPGNRTYLLDYNPCRIRQDGYIRRVTVYTKANAGGGWKLKVFRKNGSTFDFVGESNSFIPTNTDGVVQTFNLSTPVPCRVGDYIGLFVPTGGSLYNKTNGAATSRYAAGDLSASNAFATDDGTNVIGVEVLGTSPFLVATGDSIQSGQTLYHNMNDVAADAFNGDQSGEPANQLQALVPSLDYQNQAVGGATWAAGAVTQVGTIVALGSEVIWYHCGVNDVANGRSWSAIKADLETVRAAIPRTVRVFITEVLPWTGCDDQTAADIRALNANYATWCPANDVTLILCHDALGQARVSTGELDDLVPAYCEDADIHLSAVGVNVFVGLVRSAVEAAFAAPLALSAISITPTSFAIDTGATQQLTATGYDQDGNTIAITSPTWASSDVTKATVDSSGLVTGVLAGSTTITCTKGVIVSNGSAGTINAAVTEVNPAALVNKIVWVEGDMLALSADAHVATWPSDDDGGGNDLTNSDDDAWRPFFKPTGGPAGLPAVHFATDQYLNLPDCLSALTEGEVFVIVKNDDALSQSRGLWKMGSSIEYYPNSDGGIYEHFGSNTWHWGDVASVALDQWNVYNVVSRSGEFTVRLNGVTQFTTATNSVAFPSDPTLGHGSAYLVGTIAGLLIVDAAMTTLTRNGIYKYIKTKYGITSVYS